MTPTLALLWLALADVPDTHTVVDRETCLEITRRYFGPGSSVELLHRWNQLGPLPHQLVKGQVLRLKAPGPSADATLTFLKPSVRARTEGAWEPARLGMSLFKLNEVNTLRRAGAELTLRDASQLLLDENALVVILGDPDAHQVLRGPAIIEGEVRLWLAAQPRLLEVGGATVAGSTAEGVASVDEANTARVSIFEGEVVVQSQSSKVSVGRDQGTVVKKGERPTAARALPAVPSGLELASVVFTSEAGLASLPVRWAAVPGAHHYRVQLARDARFLDLAESVTTSSVELTFERLVVGRYLLRIIAFDVDGLQGRASPPRPVVVARVAAGQTDAGLVHVAAGQTPTFDAPGLSLALADGGLQAGRRRAELRTEDGGVVGEVLFSVHPRAPKTRVENERLVLQFEQPLDGTESLVVRDARGVVPMTARSATVLESQRPVTGTTTLTWDGFPLLRFER